MLSKERAGGHGIEVAGLVPRRNIGPNAGEVDPPRFTPAVGSQVRFLGDFINAARVFSSFSGSLRRAAARCQSPFGN